MMNTQKIIYAKKRKPDARILCDKCKIIMLKKEIGYICQKCGYITKFEEI